MRDNKCMLTLAIVMLCLCTGTSHAGPNTYVGIYADEYHTDCSIDVTSAPLFFQAWLWVMPSDNGFYGTEFGYRSPSWVTLGPAIGNDGLAVTVGCPQDQYTSCLTFSECQYDWVWLVRWDAWAMEAGNVGEIYLVPTEWFGPPIIIADCNYAQMPPRILNNLHINEPCVTGTEEKSWGAIKALFK